MADPVCYRGLRIVGGHPRASPPAPFHRRAIERGRLPPVIAVEAAIQASVIPAQAGIHVLLRSAGDHRGPVFGPNPRPPPWQGRGVRAATGRRFLPGKAVSTTAFSPFPSGRGLGVGKGQSPPYHSASCSRRSRYATESRSGATMPYVMGVPRGTAARTVTPSARPRGSSCSARATSARSMRP